MYVHSTKTRDLTRVHDLHVRKRACRVHVVFVGWGMVEYLNKRLFVCLQEQDKAGDENQGGGHLALSGRGKLRDDLSSFGQRFRSARGKHVQQTLHNLLDLHAPKHN